ncbi:MAG: NUDIX domain-containing protein [Candidatus Jorgensenbacteria bacterium]|nr:NUDIX domain-containing protein [Candidatus Jorgensenbacteria bacterium]
MPVEIRNEYTERLGQGALTRDEDPVTHFCAYFFPYRTGDKEVFLIAHKKSGLWLSPGGHIDPGETPIATVAREMKEELKISDTLRGDETPGLLTITRINRDIRRCKTHYDIWYFIPMDGKILATKKEGEFDDARWVSLAEARGMVTDKNNLKAIDFIEKNIFGN